MTQAHDIAQSTGEHDDLNQVRGSKPYAAPTIEALDVSGTRGAKIPTVAEVTVVSGS